MSHAIFSEFLKDKDDKVKEDFLNALTESELFDFCSSQEEFSVVTGRDPMRTMRKQAKQDDVTFSDVSLEDIEERFEKFENSFPQKKDLDSLKEHAQEKTQPTVAITINLGQLHEKAGIERPRDDRQEKEEKEEKEEKSL